MNIRTTCSLLAAVFLFTASANAGSGKQNSTVEQKIEIYKANIMAGLHSDNDGVVQASMSLVAKLQLRYPHADISELKDELDAMAVDLRSPSLRYKAFIASMVCTQPSWFDNDPAIVYEDQEQFFSTASEKLRLKLISKAGQ